MTETKLEMIEALEYFLAEIYGSDMDRALLTKVCKAAAAELAAGDDGLKQFLDGFMRSHYAQYCAASSRRKADMRPELRDQWDQLFRSPSRPAGAVGMMVDALAKAIGTEPQAGDPGSANPFLSAMANASAGGGQGATPSIPQTMPAPSGPAPQAGFDVNSALDAFRSGKAQQQAGGRAAAIRSGIDQSFDDYVDGQLENAQKMRDRQSVMDALKDQKEFLSLIR